MSLDMKKIILLVLASVALCSYAGGQEYALQILPDKKVVYVDKLGMSGSTSVYEMLLMIPELISRGGVDAFGIFEVQIDGKSSVSEKTVVLQQTNLSEVEKVEISITPSVAQQKNGQGGVINIIPKKLDGGFHGEAFMYATTEMDILPSVNLSYKKDKLGIRGNFNMEYYGSASTLSSKGIGDGFIKESKDSLGGHYCQETAKFHLKYDFSDKDVLKFWVMENLQVVGSREMHLNSITTDLSSTLGKGYQFVDEKSDLVLSDKNQMEAVAMAEYTHTFVQDGELTLSGSYRFNNSNLYDKEGRDNTRQPGSAEAEVQFKQPLFSRSAHKLTLEAGYNINYNPVRATTFASKELYSSPVITAKYEIGKWTFHAGVRYQYFGRDYSGEGGANHSSIDRDFTSDINALWKINRNHSLRFVLTRGIIRPDGNMVYPEFVLDRRRGIWVRGNPALRNTSVNSLEMNYVFDHKLIDGYFVLNTGVGYNRADDLIEEKVVEPSASGPHSTGFGPLFYTTFRNSGSNDIAKLNVSAFLSKGVFSLSFAGNLFCNFMHRESGLDIYNYYNINITPIFNFDRHWVLSSKIMYNSPVIKNDSMLGDCFFMQIRLHKTIGKWTIHTEISDIFDYLTRDISKVDNVYSVSEYDLYTRYFGLGFSYRF